MVPTELDKEEHTHINRAIFMWMKRFSGLKWARKKKKRRRTRKKSNQTNSNFVTQTNLTQIKQNIFTCVHMRKGDWLRLSIVTMSRNRVWEKEKMCERAYSSDTFGSMLQSEYTSLTKPSPSTPPSSLPPIPSHRVQCIHAKWMAIEWIRSKWIWWWLFFSCVCEQPFKHRRRSIHKLWLPEI